MGSTNHAFDGGQSQGNTPYLLMICLLTGDQWKTVPTGARRRARTSNFEHAAVSQGGGCQLNHLYADVTHPWGVPTQHKINPEACILPPPTKLTMSEWPEVVRIRGRWTVYTERIYERTIWAIIGRAVRIFNL